MSRYGKTVWPWKSLIYYAVYVKERWAVLAYLSSGSKSAAIKIAVSINIPLYTESPLL